MPALFAPERHRASSRGQAPVPEGERIRQIVEQRIAARLGFQAKGKGAVGVDIDALDRVHLNGDGESHGSGIQSGNAERPRIISRPTPLRTLARRAVS